MRPARALRAGFVYFLAVFALGFCLGTVRVLVLEPRVGALAAALIELPVILGAAWVLCTILVRRMRPSPGLAERSIMGATAFVSLMIAEAGLGVFVFDVGLSGMIDGWATPAGALGLAGQAAFGVFPILHAATDG